MSSGSFTPATPNTPSTVDRLLHWARMNRIARKLSYILSFMIAVSVVTTYVMISRSDSPTGPEPQTILGMAIVNLLLVLGLVVLIARKLFTLWSSLKAGAVGSKLQRRIITVFTMVTVIPTVAVSVFSVIFFNYGIQAWFDNRVSTALGQSVAVAEAYLEEHKESIRIDAFSMVSVLRMDLDAAVLDPAFFNSRIDTEAGRRLLTEAVVFQHNRILGRSALSFSFPLSNIPEQKLSEARLGNIALMDEDDRIAGIVLLDEATNTYLYVSRLIDEKVVEHVDATQGAANQYKKLKSQIGELQVQFSLVFFIVSLVLLLTVIWYGILFAQRLVNPLSRLINATERVRAGDFSTRVEPSVENDEISTLTRRFNRMTEQLQTQRQEVTQATRMLNERRRLTEAVLEGASAGVIAVDNAQKVTLFNSSACRLLEISNDQDIKNDPILKLMPEISALLQRAEEHPGELVQEDVTLPRGAKVLTLHVRITTEMQGDKIEGYVITFDDISPLVSAQRRAAWSDVARRIAHEIKNPLTPIQLSLERLRKKHMPVDAEEQAMFLKYLDTISRHAADIGSMVDEFVSFARMPQAVIRDNDICDILKKATFSAQTGFPEIRISLSLEEDPFTLRCDERQISQILTNLLKNAAESIERRVKNGDELRPLGEIMVRTRYMPGRFLIEVMDNGVGFPSENMEKMLEPYVTTRAKGTGLGLAIVKKIMEDHKGNITLANRNEGGAMITLSFPSTLDRQYQ